LLDEAVESSLVNDSSEVVGRFSFAHALVNHTLYEDLGRTRRVRLHRRIAEALEELCGADPGDRVAELAFHWAQATTPDDPRKAIDYARLAGQRALDDLAPAEAVRWFEQARDLQRDTDALGAAERCDVLIGLGEAQRQLGEPAYRETLLAASRLAIDLHDPERAATAALANSRGWNAVYGEVDREQIDALEQAIALDDFENPGRCAVLMARQAAELQFDADHERRWAIADRALEIARESGDAGILAQVLGDYIYTMDGRKGVAALRAAVEDYRTAADESGDPARRASSALSQAIADTLEGRVRAAEERIGEARHMADKLGEPGLRWVATYFHAQVKLAQGDLAAAERIATEAFQVGTELGQPDVALVYGGQIATVHGHQGRLDEVVAVLEQALATSPGISTWLASLAYYYGLLGRRGDALTILGDALRAGFDIGYDQVRSSTLGIYAYAAFVVEYADAAEPLYGLLEPYDGGVVANGATAHGSVGTYMGCLAALLGRHELADRHFEETAAMEEREGMLVGLAHTHLCWAEALARRGDHERARVEAERALGIAREGGYALVETRASAVLAAAVPSG
jgi:tetratricopeptide (TPR) repeat protein